MRTLIFVAAILFPLAAFVQVNPEKVEFKVHGNCGGCKATIENAVNIDGVSAADWSVETKMLSLTYDPQLVNLDDVYQKIADSGYASERPAERDSGAETGNPSQNECEQVETKEQCQQKADTGGGC